MMQNKAGSIAGIIWTSLNGTNGMTVKQLKRMVKMTDKEMYLGFGWLLREDKIEIKEMDKEKELFVALK